MSFLLAPEVLCEADLAFDGTGVPGLEGGGRKEAAKLSRTYLAVNEFLQILHELGPLLPKNGLDNAKCHIFRVDFAEIRLSQPDR